MFFLVVFFFVFCLFCFFVSFCCCLVFGPVFVLVVVCFLGFVFCIVYELQAFRVLAV